MSVWCRLLLVWGAPLAASMGRQPWSIWRSGVVQKHIARHPPTFEPHSNSRSVFVRRFTGPTPATRSRCVSSCSIPYQIRSCRCPRVLPFRARLAGPSSRPPETQQWSNSAGPDGRGGSGGANYILASSPLRIYTPSHDLHRTEAHMYAAFNVRTIAVAQTSVPSLLSPPDVGTRQVISALRNSPRRLVSRGFALPHPTKQCEREHLLDQAAEQLGGRSTMERWPCRIWRMSWCRRV
ncbi:hypothetical protein BD309DRAFT_974789 [Dichomitus squalens]|nr:hypothetical protein BD309DRAFT_974789 [Dichomitus squalens]